MISILTRSSIRYLFRHPWQMALSVLGIALGVAVVVAIDLANQSAASAFELSMESVSGKATHQISGGPLGIPDTLYRNLRVEQGLKKIAPVIEQHVAVENRPGQTLLLLGLDPFAERPFRSYLGNLRLSGNGGIGPFLTQPNTALLSALTARNLGVSEGESLQIRIGSISKTVKILGLLKATDDRSRRALEGLMITDIAAAQEILEMQGRISRIDLILSEDNSQKSALLQKIQFLLPEGMEIKPSGSRSSMMEQMTRAFTLNLTALSMLALIVGMFLIYNTMTFSVVQRRSLIGLLRSIGVTRREIFTIILGEALLLGLAGTILGLLIGIILGEGLVRLVTRTINDLYFVLRVQSLSLSPLSLLKGFALGLGATVFAALKPAREATAAAPRIVLSRSFLESELRRKIPLLTISGIVLIGIGGIILLLPGKSIIPSYIGLLALIIGFTLWTPLTIIVLMKLLRPLMGGIFGIIGRMSARDVASQLSRTAVAIAALGMAVAATVGVGTMIGSFRATVVQWLESRLEADIYISAPTLISRRNDALMDVEFVRQIEQLPTVAALNMYREVVIEQPDGVMNVIGLKIARSSFFNYRFQESNAEDIWPVFRSEDVVIVSEPYAYRRDLKMGDMIRIPTDRGPRDFRVTGIHYDYASDLGVVVMSLENYRRYWDDHRISGASAYAAPGVGLDSLSASVRHLVKPGKEILIRSNRAIRETSIEIFDRTFLITDVLRILAIAVAFIGVLSALMALQLERARELGILRANGLTPKELWGMITMQTGLMGFTAGLLSLPLGTILSLVLIYIINRRSFGWTLQFQWMPEIFFQALFLAIIAAILAGIYPALKMAKTSPALALREE